MRPLGTGQPFALRSSAYSFTAALRMGSSSRNLLRSPAAAATESARTDRGAGSVGLDQRLQRGEVLHHGVGVTLELLVGHLRALPKSEDHFAPIAVADDP